MKAVIEVKEIFQDWHPPFQKKIASKEIEVREGEFFEFLGEKEPIFQLKKIDGNKALISYNRLFTLKGFSQPSSRSVWIKKNSSTGFTSLWAENGTTKQLKLIDVIE